ncbi:MAG: RDD family protein [Puniceicoccales bacterium]|jgi:uncharacterized RDD family membrane protein YckC|nr:RDD family protein [Puniceicoccales bacterium]
MVFGVKNKQSPLPRRFAAYFLDVTLALMLAITILLWVYPKFFPQSWEILSGSSGKIGQEFLLHQSDGDRAELLHLFAATQLVIFAILTLYFWLSEVLSGGGSLGKCMFRVRVLDCSSGKRPDSIRLFLRSATSSLCLTVCSPFLFANFICAIFRRDRRCFHDIICGTCVGGD